MHLSHMSSISAFKCTHVRPREGQAIGKLLCFLDKKVVPLSAEFVCADEPCHVTDSALKEAENVINTRYSFRRKGPT